MMNQYSATTVKVVFFMSGFAALIYQIAWQRMLFTAFGVESRIYYHYYCCFYGRSWYRRLLWWAYSG